MRIVDVALNLGAQLYAVHNRHHHITHNNIDLLTVHHLKSNSAILGTEHAIPVAQHGACHVQQLLVILNKQDRKLFL